jgi:ATP-dependent Clp protease ATP-binding subunit ClpA
MCDRPLKRLFESELKKPLAKRILFEDLRHCKLIVQFVDGDISFATAEA